MYFDDIYGCYKVVSAAGEESQDILGFGMIFGFADELIVNNSPGVGGDDDIVSSL